MDELCPGHGAQRRAARPHLEEGTRGSAWQQGLEKRGEEGQRGQPGEGWAQQKGGHCAQCGIAGTEASVGRRKSGGGGPRERAHLL